MTAKVADRVKETSTTTGTGTLNLDGAVSGFQTFVAGIGTGNTCYYAIAGGAEWEIGIGTVTDATPDTLSRTTVLASSNAGSLVSLSSGTKDVFVTLPAAYAGGTVLLKELTASSSASIAFEGLISGLYDHYIVDFLNVLPANSTIDFRMQVGTGGTPTYDTGSNYAYAKFSVDSGGSTGGAGNAGTTFALIVNSVANTSTKGVSGRLHALDPGNAVSHKLFTWDVIYFASGLTKTTGGAQYLSATAITALKFFFSSGNIASGVFRLYGVAK